MGFDGDLSKPIEVKGFRERVRHMLEAKGEGEVNHALLFDNSSADEPYRFVAEFEQGALIRKAKHIPKWSAGIVTKGR